MVANKRKKIWYIFVNGEKQGPFSFNDLKCDDRICSETLVWREGFAVWLPIREVPELKELLEDDRLKVTSDQELAIDNQTLIPPNVFWILAILFAISIYLCYHIYFFSPR